MTILITANGQSHSMDNKLFGIYIKSAYSYKSGAWMGFCCRKTRNLHLEMLLPGLVWGPENLEPKVGNQWNLFSVTHRSFFCLKVRSNNYQTRCTQLPFWYLKIDQEVPTGSTHFPVSNTQPSTSTTKVHL